MKLLHVLTTLDVGGAEMHVLSQVRGQTARGHEVRVAYLKGHGTLADDFRSAGAGWVGEVGGGPGALLRLRGHLAWCDLVHSHLLKADALTAAAATLFGKRSRLVSGKHNDEQVLKKPLVSLVHGVVGNLPARVIVLSDHVGRFIERHGRVNPERMERVYYGIDPAPFEEASALTLEEVTALRSSLGIGSKDVVFTCVARFAPQKAHDVLLRGFAKARARWHQDQGPGSKAAADLRLLLVGDDPFGDGRRKAEALAGEIGLLDDGGAIFAGIRRDVPALLGASDVFTMASLWEGLGLVFLEAMATGLPVLSTNVSAIPEVVVHGETGILVPPSDPRALCDEMLRLARDPGCRLRLGEAGRERVHGVFGLDRMVEETLAIYRTIVEE